MWGTRQSCPHIHRQIFFLKNCIFLITLAHARVRNPQEFDIRARNAAAACCRTPRNSRRSSTSRESGPATHDHGRSPSCVGDAPETLSE